MKRIGAASLAMLLSIMLVVPLNSENLQGGWIKTYGGKNTDAAVALLRTSEGGYVFAGYTTSFGAGGSDFWLVKTDTSGNLQWNRTYGGTSDDTAWDLVQTSDGGYALAGYTSSFGAGSRDFWLVKTDVDGNVQWNQTYGGRNPDDAYALVQTSDGGYTMVGISYSLRNDSGSELWLVKADSSGAMQWNRTYGGTNVIGGMGQALVQTNDGGYAILGITTSATPPVGSVFWLIETDADGDAQWNRTFGGTVSGRFEYNQGKALVQTTDGGYALVGLTESFGTNRSRDFWLVKTDASGSAQWNSSYGGAGDDAAYGLVQNGDGGYALVGITESFGAGDWDSWLVKTDLNGNVQWNQTYGGTNNDEIFDLVQTSDGGYVLAGWEYSFGAGDRDAWLVRTDANGLAPEFPVPAVTWTVDWQALLILGLGIAATLSAVILAKRRFSKRLTKLS